MHHAMCMHTNKISNPGQPGMILNFSLYQRQKVPFFSLSFLFNDASALVTQPVTVTVSGNHSDLLARCSLLESSWLYVCQWQHEAGL